jgi:hypothetical protein
MTKNLLEDSIDNLLRLKVELQGKVEDSDIQYLDRAILDLRALQGSEVELSLMRWRTFFILAEVILLIPSVAEAIDSLVRVIEIAASH